MSSVLTPEIVPPSTFIAVADSFNLTIKQKLWADYYLETRNAFKSAELAGYQGDYNTLCQIGKENLRKPTIQAYLEDRFSTMVIGSNELLAKLSEYARHDVHANPDSPIQPKDVLKAIELGGKFYKHWDRNETEISMQPDQLVTIFAAAFERLREQRAAEQQAQLEAVNPSESTP